MHAVSKKLNISRTKLQKIIDDLIACGYPDIIQEVSKQDNKKGRYSSPYYITENGLKEIEQYIIEPIIENNANMPLNAPKNDFNNNSIIETLQEQLKAKDGQIQALQEQLQSKDNIINSLLEQSKNFQVLLQGQQVLSLPQKKQGILKRFFSRSADE